MPSEDAMVAAVEAYVARYNAADLDGVVNLFAPEAVVEDPVGTPARRGRAALREFFAVGIAAGARLTLDGPVRVAADSAAFPFHVSLEWEGQATRIDVIDVFRFDETGRIADMRAFFGRRNTHAAGAH
jgi:steroid delta-isomerase